MAFASERHTGSTPQLFDEGDRRRAISSSPSSSSSSPSSPKKNRSSASSPRTTSSSSSSPPNNIAGSSTAHTSPHGSRSQSRRGSSSSPVSNDAVGSARSKKLSRKKGPRSPPSAAALRVRFSHPSFFFSPRESTHSSPATSAASTVMSFAVSVPVLSVQMTVALPIVSHAPRYRTRLFSANIWRTENANASVVASGRPSGTATTTTVTPRTKKRR